MQNTSQDDSTDNSYDSVANPLLRKYAGDNAPSAQGTSISWPADIKWQRFNVPFEYPIAFTEDIFSPRNPLLADILSLQEEGKRHRCLVYIDDGVVDAQRNILERIHTYFVANSLRMSLLGDPLVVPGGEQIKLSPAYVMNVQQAIHRLGVDRHSFVIAIGGGAVLDAIGFAAATAHRGVRHIRIPSTVLSQNDSGVGVKNGINLNGVKNFTGTFAPPWAVLNDYSLLHSLAPRERLAGISEAIKVALIRDKAFFQWMENNVDQLAAFEPGAEQYMVRRSAELHMQQIAGSGDPFERGSARPLDFGHWAAHKLESLTGHNVRHGEAVAIGIALDARYSVLAGLLPPGEDERVLTLLEGLGLPIFHEQLIARDAQDELMILKGLGEFREHLGGELAVTLLEEIGQGIEVHAVERQWVEESIAWLLARTRQETEG